jgi:DNA (cytosine-5)-methyltransferase 1
MLPGHRPVAVDLFAGVGGFSLGFEQAGFDVVAAVEYDPIHASAHAFNFPLTEIVCADAAKLTASELRAAVRRGIAAFGREKSWDGEIDAIFGGTPCQGFSAGGKRAPDDDRNLLIFDFRRLVVALRPRYFVMENVPGMRSFADPDFPDDKMLDRLIAGFKAAGYRILKPCVLNASEYGVPQDRRRLIILGARKDQPLPAYPSPKVQPVPKCTLKSPQPPEQREDTDSKRLPNGPTVWDAIGDLPNLDSYDELWHSDEVELSEEQLAAMEAEASTYSRTLRGLDVDPADLSYPRSWDSRVLTSSTRTAHALASIKRFAETAQGERETTSRFLRLDANGLCSTLRAGTGYERGSFMAPRPIHPTLDRVISVREAARLHSFPDWFRFHVTKWHGFRQIGNALPPLLGREIASEIANTLGAAPARPTEVLEPGDFELLQLGTSKAAARLGVDLNLVPSHRLRTRGPKKQVEERTEPLAA